MTHPCENGCNGCDECTDFDDQPAAAVSEPVAYRVHPRFEDLDGYFDFTDDEEAAKKLQAKGWTIVPLYTTPPAAPLPEPLSDEQIENIWKARKPAWSEAVARNHFARAIEKAHNIGAKE